MSPGPGTSYRSAHRKVYRSKGPARMYPCLGCGGPATDWSYDGLDPDEMYGSNNAGTAPRAYSMNPDHYHPRCRRCHLQMDRGVSVCAQGHRMDVAGKRGGMSRGCAQCHRDRQKKRRERMLAMETPEEAAERRAKQARQAREWRARRG